MSDRLWTGGRRALRKGAYRKALIRLQKENLAEFHRRGYLGRLRLAFALRGQARRLVRKTVPDSALY